MFTGLRSSWSSLRNGIPDWQISTTVYCMEVFQDTLYVGGNFAYVDRALIVIVGSASQIREPLGSLGLPLHELDLEGQAIA